MQSIELATASPADRFCRIPQPYEGKSSERAARMRLPCRALGNGVHIHQLILTHYFMAQFWGPTLSFETFRTKRLDYIYILTLINITICLLMYHITSNHVKRKKLILIMIVEDKPSGELTAC